MQYRLRFIAIALLLALISVRPTGAATPIFLLDTNVGGPTVLFQVDPTSGQLTMRGTVSTGAEEVLGLAAASQSLLYAASYSGEILAVTLEPSFSVTSTGCVGPAAIVGLAFTNGVLYATEERTSTLSRIDLSSCTTTLIGTVTVPIQGGDIAENGSGQWYLWTNSTQDLYLLDVTTAVATQLDPANQGLGPKSGLAFDYQGGGTLFASSGGTVNSLLTLNPATGLAITSVPFSHPHHFGDLASPRCTDVDGDGFSPEGGPCGPVDCDDNDPHINPGAAEVCNNVDDNCDGIIDEEPAASASCAVSHDDSGNAVCIAGSCTITSCTDVDGDGFSPDGGPCGPVDCNDNDPHINPAAAEVCNSVDDNCDGVVDEEPAASASCAGSNDDSGEEPSTSPIEEPSPSSSSKDVEENPSADEKPSDERHPSSHGNAVCVAGSCTIAPPTCQDPSGCHPPEPGACNSDTDCLPGEVCHSEKGCLIETAPCALPSGAFACTPGSNHGDHTCTAEWFVDNPANPRGALSTTQTCRQGDPQCDHDTDPATCTFRVAACLRVSDPRLPACTPSDVVAFSVRVSSTSRGSSAAADMLAAFDALPGARTQGKNGRRDVSFSPPLGTALCTAETSVVVPVGGKLRLRGTATTVTGAHDSDVLRFRCL